jgi:hypothetical protein
MSLVYVDPLSLTRVRRTWMFTMGKQLQFHDLAKSRQNGRIQGERRGDSQLIHRSHLDQESRTNSGALARCGGL